MTLRSRINQRIDRTSARAERVTTRRSTALETRTRTERAPAPRTTTTMPTPDAPILVGSSTCWDAPCSSLRAPANSRRTTRHSRNAVTAAPVDWSAVRNARGADGARVTY